MIEMISPTEFHLTKGCHEMTLLKREFGWEMLTDSPSTRAWNSVTPGGMSMPGFHSFKTLQEVEQHYKSWRGIAVIVASLGTSATAA
jgi:hypothetical protein